LAVELADALVADGTPFRAAHQRVGALWAAAEGARVDVAALPLELRLAIDARFTDERLGALTLESALARRSHPPGGGPESVLAQLKRAEQRPGPRPPSGGSAPVSRGFASVPPRPPRTGRLPRCAAPSSPTCRGSPA